MIRLLSVLLVLVGAAVGVGYPFVQERLSETRLTTLPAYDAAQGGTIAAETELDAAGGPVTVDLVMTADGHPTFAPGAIVLTLTVDTAGRTVLAETFDFAVAPARETSPQGAATTVRVTAGGIDPVETGLYRFTVGPGDSEAVAVRQVTIELRQGAAGDPRVQPVGFGVLAIGVIALTLSLRRRPAEASPPAAPVSPRWGRDAGKTPEP